MSSRDMSVTRQCRKKPSSSASIVLYFALAIVMAGAPSLSGAQVHPAAPLQAGLDGRAAAPASEQNARADAPWDPTGYWTSVVTADWRDRMVIPMRGDYAGIPINQAAKTFADRWNRAADEAAGKQCEAYGAGSVMINPEHLHITWQDNNTLKVETDQGMQTRVFNFDAPDDKTASRPDSLQGYSRAQWHRPPTSTPPPVTPDSQRRVSAPVGGTLGIFTDHLLPGLLRKNGVPHSAGATIREYWTHNVDPISGITIIVITIELTDQKYLWSPYVYNAIFQSESDGSKWQPTPCSLRW